MSDDPLLISTLTQAAAPSTAPRARVPCATIACHSELDRIGERALLTALLIRQPALLSRTDTLFAPPQRPATRRPLADPYLSRTPLRLEIRSETGRLELLDLPSGTRIDGRPAGSTHSLELAALDGGVLLELAERVLIVLHLTAAQPITEAGGMLGHSDAIERVRGQIAQLAGLELPVLVRGETGVGKERVAQALHAASARATQPLIAVNMATLAEATAAAALFGHARGAFTGAVTRHRGFFERAHGGTLFLDEVGDTPPAVQAMLLRVLDTGTIQPLGEDRERPVDVRILAATELELAEDRADSGAFRQALLHRLSGYEIRVPPLRERRDDIPRLLMHFLRSELATLNGEALLAPAPPAELAPLPTSFMTKLLSHRWPGNVRELSNVARGLALEARGASSLAAGAELCAAALPDPGTAADAPHSTAYAVELTAVPAAEVDEVRLIAALERHAFSPLRAAAELGVPPSTVHFWMRRAGIRRASDLSSDELQRVHRDCDGSIADMATRLHVSPRALRQALRRAGLAERE